MIENKIILNPKGLYRDFVNNINLHNYIIKCFIRLARFYRIKINFENKFISYSPYYYQINYFNIQYCKLLRNTLARIRSYGNWNINKDKFEWDQLWLDININKFNELWKDHNYNELNQILLHEFCHVVQYERFGFTPYKYHDVMFYLIGNEYDPDFYKKDTMNQQVIKHSKENIGKYSELKWDLENKYYQYLFKQKRFLNLNRMLRKEKDYNKIKELKIKINKIRLDIRRKILVKNKILKQNIKEILSEEQKIRNEIKRKESLKNRRRNKFSKLRDNLFEEYKNLHDNKKILDSFNRRINTAKKNYENGKSFLGENQIKDRLNKYKSLSKERNKFLQKLWDEFYQKFEIEYKDKINELGLQYSRTYC